jgi:anti-sigma regulatory factor (Ser/Thr protein kinase)/anti-anti-sigma regulatory factor
MGRLRAVLEEHLAAGDAISDALTAVDAVAGRLPGAAAATVCVVVLDPASGMLEYSTAGHPPPLLVSAEGWRYLPITGAGPLGSRAGFSTAAAQVGQSELMLLYTDGLIERPGRTVAESTVELAEVAGRALTDRVFAGAQTHSSDRVCEQILELLTRATGYADDITVLAARRIDPPAALAVVMQADRTASAAVAVELERWLAAVDAGPSDQAALRHAMIELVSNAIEHAYRQRPPGPVTVHADLHPDGYAAVTVADQGRWREPADVIEETRANGDSRFRGLGLAMVWETVDEFTLDHDTAGTTARLRRRLRRPAPLLADARGTTGRQAPPNMHDKLVITPIGTSGLAVRGPLHLGTVAVLETRLAMESRGGTRSLTLDLSGLTHLASAGVQLLQKARRTARDHGEELRLVAGRGSIADHVLDLVAVDHGTEAGRADYPGWP